MRIALTGGTGFLGSHLKGHFERQGHEVMLVSRGVRAVKLAEQFYAKKIEAVVHLASFFTAEHTPEQIRHLVESNILFGAEVLEAMALSRVPFLVNAGTSWQNFSQNSEQNFGDESYNPMCLYAATKQAFEDLLRFYTDSNGMRAVTLRLFDTYGPNDRRPKLIPKLFATIKAGGHIKLSPGEQLLDLLYLDDVMTGFEAALEQCMRLSPGAHEVYGLSSGERFSLRAVAGMIEDVTGQKLNVEWGGRPYRRREVMMPFEGYRQLPQWEPKVGLSEGLALTWKDWEHSHDIEGESQSQRLPKNILLLGGTGYLGSQMATAFAQAGARVMLLKRAKSPVPKMLSACPGAERIAFVDLAEDASRLPEVIQSLGTIDVVVNCLASYGRNNESYDELEWVNHDLPAKVWKIAVERGATAFVNADTVLLPGVSTYAKTKAHLRDTLRSEADQGSVINVRLDQFYGPDDHESKIVTMLIRAFLDEKPEVNLTSGYQVRRFIHVSDVIEYMFRATCLASRLPVGFYESTPELGELSTVREFVEKVYLFCGSDETKVNFGALPSRAQETCTPYTSPELRDLTFENTCDLANGLKKTIELERKMRFK